MQVTENAVMFSGDGEPRSPDTLVRQLVALHEDGKLVRDSYSREGNVKELEVRFAELLGKESAAFMPTGTLANHLAIRALCAGKSRAVVQEQSHLYHDTGDSVTQLSGINLVPIARGKAYFTLDELIEAVEESSSGRVSNPIGAVMIESPVRRQMGQVAPFNVMKAITEYCREQGIGTHLDGARLYMMSAVSGISPKAYSALFDTVYVSLYKYFGAPFGAILAGDLEIIDDMYHTRRMFGGGLDSVYFAAAIALKGVDGFEERFASAISKGRELFDMLNTLPGISIGEFEHGSNIFPVAFSNGLDTMTIVRELEAGGIHVQTDEASGGVSALTVNTTILRQSNDAIFNTFKDALIAVRS